MRIRNTIFHTPQPLRQMIDSVNICRMNEWMNGLVVDLMWVLRDRKEKKGARNCSQMSDFSKRFLALLCLVAQSCPTLCNPMDCSPPGTSVHGASPGKNDGEGCHALLQGVCSAQGSSSGLLRVRPIPYCLSHHGAPKNTGGGSLSLLQGILWAWLCCLPRRE